MPIQNKEVPKTTTSIDYSKEKPIDVVKAMTNLKTNVSKTIEETNLLAENISLLSKENQEKFIGIIKNRINLDKVA